MKTIYVLIFFSFFSCGIFSQVKTIKVRNADTSCTVFIEGAVGNLISLEKLKTATKIEFRGGACACETVETIVTIASGTGAKIYTFLSPQFTEDMRAEFQSLTSGSRIWFEVKLHGKKEKTLPAIMLKII
ncbi:MAG: hypothetical protein IAF38_14065 [Bacteroidia bacterium]|nr:hypothetical protein [Bacteroidia bacterium]